MADCNLAFRFHLVVAEKMRPLFNATNNVDHTVFDAQMSKKPEMGKDSIFIVEEIPL